MNFEKITSRNNPLIKETAKLSEKKQREASGLFAFEGRKLLNEALLEKLPLEHVFVTEKALPLLQGCDIKCKITVVGDEVYEKISFEKSPEGIFCVSKTLDKIHNIYIIYRREDFSDGTFLLLDGIQDPGNLGTMLRTASAFGCKTVILSSDCADIYNPKTIRASMGAVFRQNTVRVSDLCATVNELKTAGKTVLAATLDKSSYSLFDIKVDENVSFVIGNEGNGISQGVIEATSGSVVIPMEARTESLNAASAATVLLYEQYRNLHSL